MSEARENTNAETNSDNKAASDVQRIELSQVEEQVQPEVKLTQRDYRLVKSMPVEVTLMLGSTELSVEKLFGLKAGEILSLDTEVNEPVTLMVEGNAVAAGNLVAVDGQFGIEITDIQG